MTTVRETFISVDVEASGPIPGIYSMLSVGACVVDDPERSFYVELRPLSDAVDERAMRAIGRSLASFAESGRDPFEAMRDFRDWVLSSTHGSSAVFVGFNATFDWAFVNWYFHKCLGENPFGFGGVDAKSYYMGLRGVAWADTKSSQVAADLGMEHSHSHHALDDAIEQAAMFLKMLAAPRKRDRT